MKIKFIVLSFFLYLSLSSTFVLGQEKAFTFDPEKEYSICYALDSQHTALVNEVYINSVSNVGGKSILTLTQKDAPPEDEKMYISMSSIIAIVTADEAKKEINTFCNTAVPQPTLPSVGTTILAT